MSVPPGARAARSDANVCSLEFSGITYLAQRFVNALGALVAARLCL